MSDAPFFIVGTERSGSNLLRLILDAHGRIAVPHPPHIMRYFGPLEDCYKDLQDPARLRRLVEDVLLLVRVHIYPWSVRLDPAVIAAAARPPCLFTVYAAVYDAYRRDAGKARWGCKSTFMLERADTIFRHVPDARLVWLVRDPRDVAASSKRSVFNPYAPLFTAELWRQQQEIALDLERRYGPTVVRRLRYEDLLAAPEGRVREVCRFLDEEYDPAMLRYHEGVEARRTASLCESWHYTDRPVLHENTRYRRELDEREVRQVETVAGDLMERLGYRREVAHAAAGIDLAERLRSTLDEAGLRLLAEARSWRGDRNHWRRRARDAYVATLGLVRRRPALSRVVDAARDRLTRAER
jgi:hypothetical protein